MINRGDAALVVQFVHAKGSRLRGEGGLVRPVTRHYTTHYKNPARLHKEYA